MYRVPKVEYIFACIGHRPPALSVSDLVKVRVGVGAKKKPSIARLKFELNAAPSAKAADRRFVPLLAFTAGGDPVFVERLCNRRIRQA